MQVRSHSRPPRRTLEENRAANRKALGPGCVIVQDALPNAAIRAQGCRPAIKSGMLQNNSPADFPMALHVGRRAASPRL